MKTAQTKQKKPRLNGRVKKILASLRAARKDALKTARLHGTSIVYLRDGKHSVA